jgi:hypothetical protein
MPQQAVWRGLLEGFLQSVSVFIEAGHNFIFLFSPKQGSKKFICAYTENTDLIFKTFKKIIHLVTQFL